ncbi:MAG: hypothetical protein M3N97_00725 [Pseudomonadota bacterium]|nr:hypothetical protein [Pseudomonadota bacterium]
MALLVSLGAVSFSRADTSTTITGFGTVGGSISSNSDYAYRHDPTEANGATNQFDIGLESRLGVQAMVDFGSGITVTAQEIARQRGAEAFSLGTEWLYLQYQPSSDWKLRMGRVALATFLMSDSREVGYAAPWFHAPNELYGSNAFQYVDGGEVRWHHSLGPVGILLEGSLGSSTSRYFFGGQTINIAIKDESNVAATLDYGDLRLRVARTRANSATTLPLGPTLVINYILRDVFTSVGMQYDNGKALVLSEWAQRSENDVPSFSEPLARSHEWYVAGGWRFGKLTPLLSYGDFSPGKSFLMPAGKFGTWSGSLRYDVVRNVALKAQILRAQAANSTYWTSFNAASDKRINVYSVGADFVF